jgi:xanthine dehydrogenase YagR molybdenum-binding subunit
MPVQEQTQSQQSKDVKGATKGEAKPVQASHDQPVHPAAPKTAAPRKVKLQAGIASAAVEQDALTEVTRIVPANEPAQLPTNDELRLIGKRIPRVDGALKTTGRARYTADVYLPGMLYGAMITSTMPHARIRAIDLSKAKAYPGVKGVYILKHISDQAEVKDKSKEMPSRYPIVRFAGQPIGGVAATSQAAAEEAVKLVEIDYEQLPFVTSVEDARRPDSPAVYPAAAAMGATAGGGGGDDDVPQKGNLRGPAVGPRGGKGSVEKGFAEAEVTVEGDYRTQVQTHCSLETHGVVADWKPEMLTVYASTQGTPTVRDELAEVFGIPKGRVRVITEFMGGGFGAKFGAGNFGVVATSLSKQTGAPVKMMLTRKQEQLSSGNRPDSRVHLKIGAKTDGTLTAMQLVSYGTAGVGTGAGAAGPTQNMYKCANVHTEEYDVFTNAGPAAAMRAPGHPQGAFALEQAIDELAEKLGIDPLEFRDKNDEHPARREERRIGAQLCGWSERHKPGADAGPVKRGLGVAQSVWYRIGDTDSHAEVRIGRDGSVELMSSVQDIGGGIRTILAQVVAEELGLEPRDITMKIGDTSFPQGPSSGGSQTTNSITPAARNAAYRARQLFLEDIAPALQVSAKDLDMRDGKVVAKSDPSKLLTFKQAAGRMKTEEISARAQRPDDYKEAGGHERFITYGGVQFAQVAVDTETGAIKVEKVWAIHDCGRPMNPLLLENQINGGVLQGVSYALYEDRIIDRNYGYVLNPNLEQYKILGSRETPEIQVHVIENILGLSSTDAGGIGEPSKIPTAAAVANAVYNATGVRVRQLPMRPATMLAALGKVKGMTA